MTNNTAYDRLSAYVIGLKLQPKQFLDRCQKAFWPLSTIQSVAWP